MFIYSLTVDSRDDFIFDHSWQSLGHKPQLDYLIDIKTVNAPFIQYVKQAPLNWQDPREAAPKTTNLVITIYQQLIN